MKKRYKAYLESIGFILSSKKDGKDMDEDDTEDEHHHHGHDHKHDEEIDHLHPHDCLKCAVCTRMDTGDPLCDWLTTMHKFIQQLQDDNFKNRR